MTEMLRKALLEFCREWQLDQANGWPEDDQPIHRAMQTVVQALEVENMRKTKVVKPRRGRS